MSSAGPIALRRTAVVPVAVAAARRPKLFAIAAGVLCGISLLAGASDVIRDSKRSSRDDGSAVFMVGVTGVACLFGVRRAHRTMAAARRAAADPGSTWTLVGNLVVAADDRGQPAPQHSFKVTRSLRAALLADRTNDVEMQAPVGSPMT